MLDLALANDSDQVAGVAVELHFRDNDHNSIRFKIVF